MADEMDGAMDMEDSKYNHSLFYCNYYIKTQSN